MDYHGIDLLRAKALRSGAGAWLRARRWWRHLGVATAWLVIGAVAAVLAGVIVLARGPVAVEGLPDRVARALETKLGVGWRAQVQDAALSWSGLGPSLSVSGLTLRDPRGALVLSAPAASIGIGVAAAFGDLRPRSVAFERVDLRLAVRPDGSIGLAQETLPPTAPAEPAIEASAEAPRIDAAALGASLGALIAVFTGENGPFGVLDRASLAQSRLLLVDRRRVEHVAFEDIAVDLERTGDSARAISASMRGKHGVWRIAGIASGREGEVRAARVTLAQAPLSDLMLLVGQSALPVASDSALSGEVEARIAADDRIETLEARLRVGEGTAQVGLAGFPPLVIAEGVGLLSWNAGERSFDLRALDFDIGGVRAALNGRIWPANAQQPWRAELQARELAIAALETDVAPWRYDGATLQASLPDDGATLAAQFALARGEARIDGRIQVGIAERSPIGLDMRIVGSRLAAREGLRLWPAHINGDVRNYLIGALETGTIEAIDIASRLSPAEYAATYRYEPMPDGGLRATFALSGVDARIAEGLPVLREADMNGLVTGRTARLTGRYGRIVAADGRSLAMTDAVFHVSDTSLWHPPTTLNFRASGTADALVAALASPLIRQAVPTDLDPAQVKGSTSLRVGLAFILGEPLARADLKVQAQGQLTNIAVEQALGAERLENGNLTLAFERNALSIKGEARAFGQPVQVDVRQPANGAGEAAIGLQLDEAGRARYGLNFGTPFTGALPVRIAVPLPRQPGSRPRIEVDLTRPAIEGIVPGWSKPANRPAKLAFAYAERPGGGVLMEDLQAEGAGLVARGQGALAADGGLDTLDLTSFKLSPGDDMRVKLERTGGVARIQVRGSVVDARPFLKGLGGGDAPAPAPARRPSARGSNQPTPITPPATGDGPAFDLDLTTPILAGHNDEAITNADLKLSRRGGEWRQFRLVGRLGGKSVDVELARDTAQRSIAVLRSADAGRMLRFLDLYNRMAGGDLLLTVTPGADQQAGTIQVRDFILRNEPALRRILAEQPTGAVMGDRVASTPAPPLDPNAVEFTKMKADFARAGGRMDVRDAVIWGPQVGLSIAGYIDSARDRTDLAGTYVPAYGLNNIFAQVPLFGPLLGGGQYEGLFAVNFRISGAASAPTLTINPLSAVAPGIFRRFFEAGRSDPSGVQGNPPPGPER